jgi:general secretion pathway protein G
MTAFVERERGTGNGERAARCQSNENNLPIFRSGGKDGTCEDPSRSPFPFPRSLRASRATGFTLLEMLAVIALIGIVAVAVITKVIPSFDKGKYKTGKIQLNSLGQDIDNYVLDNGSPPQQLQDLVAKPVNAPNWQGPYAKESQLKDPYGHDFGYQYPGQHAKYDLIFYGEDGKPGGEGLNADAGNWQ